MSGFRFETAILESLRAKFCPELSWAELGYVEAMRSPEFRRAAEEAKERCRLRREAEREYQAAAKAWAASNLSLTEAE